MESQMNSFFACSMVLRVSVHNIHNKLESVRGISLQDVPFQNYCNRVSNACKVNFVLNKLSKFIEVIK